MSLSRVRLFASSRTAARQALLSFTVSCSLLKFMSIESVMLFQPSHSLMLKPKLQYSGHLIQSADSLGKTLMLGKIDNNGRRRRQRVSPLFLILKRGTSLAVQWSRLCLSPVGGRVQVLSLVGEQISHAEPSKQNKKFL